MGWAASKHCFRTLIAVFSSNGDLAVEKAEPSTARAELAAARAELAAARAELVIAKAAPAAAKAELAAARADWRLRKPNSLPSRHQHLGASRSPFGNS